MHSSRIDTDLNCSSKQVHTAARYDRCVLKSLALACLAVSTSLSTVRPQGDQLRSPVERVSHDGANWWLQRGTSALTLTPNESFFDGTGLIAQGEGAQGLPGNELNKGKSFASVRGFQSGNSVSWFLLVEHAGELQLAINGRKTASLRFACGDQAGSFPGRLTLDAGVHRIRLRSKDADAVMASIALTGPAAKGAAVLRTRWRPAAAHTRFSASTLSGNSKLWVMEMDAAPGEASFYSPMTTPFGYFGSSWTVEGRPKGCNFSMWSYGRGKQEPPVEQLSHLIAVGHPKMNFGGFGHEGTGVKPRGWNPFDNWQGQRVVYALRYEPGEIYDTYYGYYFDEASSEWRLYAAGRKTHGKRSPATLWAGSFVEVPGPPQRQRTGHITRTMRYRGFQMDAAGRWHALDQMKGEGKPGTFGNRHRWVTEDGRFAMSMGGMEQRGPNPGLTLEQAPVPDLPWLAPEATKALLTMPTLVAAAGFKVEAGNAQLQLDVHGLGADAKVTVYYGADNALTFADRWQCNQQLEGVHEGQQTLRWPCDASARFARVLVENRNGRYWSR